MDYMYGNLQHQVEKVEYTGKESSTAVVLVHPRENTILVDVKPLSPSILKPQIDFNKDGEYVLIGIVENTNVKYKWTTKEEMSDFLQEQINDLQLQIHQLDVNESQYREQIALDIDRIEKEIESIDNEMSMFETEQHMFNNNVTVYMDTTNENIRKLFVGLYEEIENRKSADNTLQENIDKEASIRESEDTQLSNRIVTATNVLQNEINSLQEEDTILQSNIDAEAEEREKSDTQINSTISEMIERDACTIKVVNSDDYKIGVFLYNYEGKKISSSSIDLPLESVVVSGRYDAEKKEIILTLENGTEIEIPVEDLIAGLANETEIEELHDELNSFEASQGVFNEKVSVFITNTTKAVDSIQEELNEEEKTREEEIKEINNSLDDKEVKNSYSFININNRGVVVSGQNMIEVWEEGQKTSDTLAIGGIAFADITDSFEEESWSSIAKTASNGLAKTSYNIGDTKTFTTSDGEKIEVRIVDFGDDTIVLETTSCLEKPYQMNSTATNINGWESCELRNTLQTIYDTFPEDLQSVIKTSSRIAIKEKTDDESISYAMVNDKLYIPSVADIYSKEAIQSCSSTLFNTYATAYTNEGSQMEYYKNLIGDAELENTNEKIAREEIYWLRSMNLSDNISFEVIDSEGKVQSQQSNTEAKISICFVI